MNHELTQYGRIAVFGGIYNNYLALEATIADARARGAESLFCLGDMGGFGPHPDRVFPLLKAAAVRAIQGNYDHSLAMGLDNCQCGYTDPQDNAFAALSYQYTFTHTAPEHKAWLGTLPRMHRFRLGSSEVLLCHGSPRAVNEFLWESTTPDCLLRRFCRDTGANVLCFTHTGIKWHRALGDGRHAINVGVIGRPENDGKTVVWYALLTAGSANSDLMVEFVPVDYEHERLVREMETEGLPVEFIETIRTGWWTTCLEILPAKERARSKY